MTQTTRVWARDPYTGTWNWKAQKLMADPNTTDYQPIPYQPGEPQPRISDGIYRAIRSDGRGGYVGIPFKQQTAAICSCCERTVPFVRGSMWHDDRQICLACFYVWYDCGLTSPAEIKDYVLKAEREQGFPFTGDVSEFKRVESAESV